MTLLSSCSRDNIEIYNVITFLSSWNRDNIEIYNVMTLLSSCSRDNIEIYNVMTLFWTPYITETVRAGTFCYYTIKRKFYKEFLREKIPSRLVLTPLGLLFLSCTSDQQQTQ
jgi:hypothetical protein